MSTNVTPNQVKAIAALLIGTVGDAAKAANVSDRTIQRWLKEAAFKKALAEAEAAVLAEAARIAAGASSKAVRELLAILEGEAETKHKVAAARALLTALPAVRMIGAIEGKLADLEANLDGKPKRSDETD